MGGKHWTKEEVEILESYWGKWSREAIAKRCNKSIEATRDKAFRLGLGGMKENIDGLTITDVANIVGVDSNSVLKVWIDNGLKTKKVGYYRVVKEKELRRFMESHPYLWDARKCDYYYFYPYKWFTDKLERERNVGKAETKYHRWTSYEERQLMMWRKQGISFMEIGNRLGRTKSSVYKKWSYLSGKLYQDVLEKQEVKGNGREN